MADVEKSITVKVEYTEEPDSAKEQQQQHLNKTGECLWCAKKLIVTGTIAGFCSESCFTASRRARFKKEKFGIDTIPKRQTNSKPESSITKVV